MSDERHHQADTRTHSTFHDPVVPIAKELRHCIAPLTGGVVLDYPLELSLDFPRFHARFIDLLNVLPAQRHQCREIIRFEPLLVDFAEEILLKEGVRKYGL
jgi:hypothetical protein